MSPPTRPEVGLIPVPDASSWQWSRALVGTMDADAIRAAMSSPPVFGGAAVDRSAEVLGTLNVTGVKASVMAFTVRRPQPTGRLTDHFRMRFGVVASR